MLDRYPVFIPKILPREEYFVSGRRSCKGCGKALAVRMICKMAGKDVISSHDSEGYSFLSSYGQAGVGLNWDELLSGDLTSSLVDRVIAENKKVNKEGAVRRSIKKAIIGIDRRVFIRDPLALTDVLNEHKEVLYICYDSEMYMEELIKRSLASPDDHGECRPLKKDEMGEFIQNKNIPSQVRESDLAYIATSCPSYPLDLMEKIKKGLRVPGTAFISVLTPVLLRGYLSQIRQRTWVSFAVNTGFYPLFEVEAGKLRITKRVSPLPPLIEYIKVQQRYITFPPEQLSLIQETVKEEYESLLARTE